MVEYGDAVGRLASALARTPFGSALSTRLCEAYRQLAGATGAAITVRYLEPHRVTLTATDDISTRLEDLQELVGEGPGPTAARTGQIERCQVPSTGGTDRWSIFVEAAQDLVGSAMIHAIPMQPVDHVFGVVTLYQTPQPPEDLSLRGLELMVLADALGAALIHDSTALDPQETGPWSSRARIHQATGMVIAQLHVSPDDALALMRAHAYADQTTLSDIAAAVVERRLSFSTPR